MKVRHTLICFFFLSLQDGNNGLILYTGTEGGDVTVQCSSSSGSRKILCKDPCKEEDIIIETTDLRAHEGRFSIKWSRRDVSVTITQLTKSDSGLYRCGYESSHQQFEIIIVDAGGEASSGTEAAAEHLPNLGGELGTPIRDNVHRDAVESKDMLNQQVCGLAGRRELGKGNKGGRRVGSHEPIVGPENGRKGERTGAQEDHLLGLAGSAEPPALQTLSPRMCFCKGGCEEEDILVETTSLKAQRDRYSIRYVKRSPSGGFVFVGITQLTRSDSGRYRCGLDRTWSPDPYRGFNIVVTDAPTTSEPNQAMTSSVPSASTATTTQSLSSSSGSSRAPTRGVWLYAVIVVVVVVIVIVSGLVLMIFCIWRNIKPDGLNTSRTSEGTNMEIALYENCGPVSTCEDSTYQSLHPASRDQDQTYSTLTHTQHA
ncbi:uncharacterized protein LOC142948441 [Anarhichas minor]|uniref:uncharacterized protein LOC142948441 n=1 Tax=Anarhichas minor TaxID=65739 RepID=UPI003F736D5B